MEDTPPHSSGASAFGALPFATQPASAVPQMLFGKIDDLVSRVAVAIDGARNCLFSEQHEEGYWCGELEADTTLEADYIVLHVLLGTGTPERMAKAARYILQHQNEDGGWSIYPDGPLTSAPRSNAISD